ncbi:MAG: hypothetical protein ACKOPG_03780 [Novosphingobium sp.]
MPASTWDEPVGEALRDAGLTPNHPANQALTPQRARAMEDAATAQMDALVERVNAHIPGVSVIPWAIIPWSVWEGPNAELLISTDFLPSSPWNNLLLPAEARSADFLGLPEHPRAAIPGLHENLSGMIDQLRAERSEQVEACRASLPGGGWSAIEQFEAGKQDRFQKLFALARHVAAMIFGEAVCARHDELFGIGLSDVTG